MIRWTKATLTLLVMTLPLLGAISQAEERTKRVLVIGIDGLRPDALKVAKTPNIDTLIEQGTYASNTDIVAPRPTKSDTISGPGWSNLLCGVWSDKHGSLDNGFKGTNYGEYPHFFARLKEVQPQAFTISLSNWTPIDTKIVTAADVHQDLSRKDNDYVASDLAVANKAVELLGKHDPTAMVIYFGQVDEHGHKHGFHPTVAEYTESIERVDSHVGDVIKAVQARKNFANEDWLTIVCTDHGGQGKNHGGGRTIPEIRKVFLIISGDSAAKGVLDDTTYQVDVVATALKHLGVTPKEEWKLDGKPVGLE